MTIAPRCAVVSIELFEMVESRTLFNCLMWWSKKFYKINCSRIKDSIDLFNKWSQGLRWFLRSHWIEVWQKILLGNFLIRSAEGVKDSRFHVWS